VPPIETAVNRLAVDYPDVRLIRCRFADDTAASLRENNGDWGILLSRDLTPDEEAAALETIAGHLSGRAPA
jgi:hypothetical protein